MERSQEEIAEQLDRAVQAQVDGESRWPGMSYEEGVDAALRWVTGESNDLPMEDE